MEELYTLQGILSESLQLYFSCDFSFRARNLACLEDDPLISESPAPLFSPSPWPYSDLVLSNDFGLIIFKEMVQ